MDEVFVIGDLHGSFQALEKLLTKWNAQKQRLIFLGDYINRGNDSLQVIQRVKELVEDYDAVALKGNHELMFMEWLKEPEKYALTFLNIGGVPTLQSMKTFVIKEEPTIDELIEGIKREHSQLLTWMENLPLYYRWGQYFFSHAGINPFVRRGEESTEHELLWIRDDFTEFPHEAEDIVVFGHTPTTNLNKDLSSEVWISPCCKKIGIDGGILYPDGRLNGVVLTEGNPSIIIHSVMNDELLIEQRTLAG